MHDLLFGKTQEWSGQENPVELFKGYVAQLGLNTDAFVTCLESGETAAQVQSELERGAALGVSGAPAFFVNDWFVEGAQPFEVFQETIEKALRGEHPPPTPTPLPPGATPFDPNPERPGYTYGGDAYCGSEEAEIILAVFVDFQSLENRTHFLEEWPDLEKAYVDTGKVRLMVKHFPEITPAPTTSYKGVHVGMPADDVLKVWGEALRSEQVGSDAQGLITEWVYEDAILVMKRWEIDGVTSYRVAEIQTAGHLHGFTAAEAAECAGQQGAFCAMYDLVFTKQEEWSQAEDTSAMFKEYAADLGLDAATFATCLDEGQTSDKVMEDFTIGQENQFPPAPLFFIFKGQQGGYVPVEQLQEAIEQFLAE